MSSTTATTTTTTAPMPVSKVWLITGCSSGLGRELAIAALVRGDRVIATARSATKITDLQQRGAHTIVLDVTSPHEVVQKVVLDAVAIFGRIDVLVNNAGYSLVGGIDEASDAEIAANFNTNVFGILKMLRVVLPLMRQQHSGVIANIGSLVGRQAFPALGVYCATKFAVAGLTESLRAEVADFGINVTCVELGMFRTEFVNNWVETKTTIAESSPVVQQMKNDLANQSGKQPGDPTKAAKILVDALTKTGAFAGRTLPVRLAVGSESMGLVSSVLERDAQELQEWAALVAGTDHDGVGK